MKTSILKAVFNLYPPFWGTGIHIKKLSSDFRYALIQMKLRFYNKNIAKTHFGGSLFSMTDPFLMVMLSNILGKKALVWDKAANIEFIKPGKGKVSAEFIISDAQLSEITEHIEQHSSAMYPTFLIEVLDENRDIVARVTKTLYVKARKGLSHG